MHVGTDPKNCVFIQDLRVPAAARKTLEVLPDFTAKFDFLGNDGDTLWFLTDDSASRRRVIAIDVHRPEKTAWRELIAEGPDTIESVSVVGERLIVTRLDDAHTKVTIHRLDGALERELSLPGIGSAGGFSGKRRDRETYFWYSGFSVPTEIWKLEVQSGKTSLWRRPRVAFDPADYETKQVWYQSADGTKVPMFLCARKGLRARRPGTDLFVRLRWLRDLAHAQLQRAQLGLDGARRDFGRAQPARWGRVRQGVARSREQAAQAKRIR